MLGGHRLRENKPPCLEAVLLVNWLLVYHMLYIYYYFLLFIYSQFYPTLPESVALCLLTTVPVEL